MYPCCECAKLIIQSGIRHVTYYEAKNTAASENGALDPLYVAAAKMLSLAGVTVRQHTALKPLRLELFSRAGADGASAGALAVQSTPS